MDEVRLLGMRVAVLTAAELADHVFASLADGRGGWIVTANLDFLRRFHRDPEVRRLYEGADLRVADGMPLVWASRLQGTPLPERLAGASLVSRLADEAAQRGRSVFLLGGARGAAEASARVLEARSPRLRIAGTASPTVPDPPSIADIDAVADRLCAHPPDLLFVGLGSPKQERLCAALRPRLPSTWMMGVGHTFSFLAGQTPRAPGWMQRAGLEWAHRLGSDPRRLARRYLREDLPFAFVLLAGATRHRLAGRRHPTAVRR